MPSDSSFAYPGEQPEAADIVIFGATGDLTKRKLLPALAHMLRWNLLGPDSRILGITRRPFTQLKWQDYVCENLLQFFPDATLEPHSWKAFKTTLQVLQGDLGDPALYHALARFLGSRHNQKNALFYLAIPPEWYATVAQQLHAAGLSKEREGFRRIVIEKPFGTDLASAKALNQHLQQYFIEPQIYRIDHYLGKEAVQNLMVFRFGNSVLEPLWNRNYIDHVQISVAESLGLETRAGYYEHSGALKDMIQSHLIQVMSLVAMEPPLSLAADDVRSEKVKVMRAIRRLRPEEITQYTVRAQYAAGTISGAAVPAYREEAGVAKNSQTETFAAVKLYIDNWRWQNIPFLLRTGKRLPHRVSEICIRFRSPPQTLFSLDQASLQNNELIFRLQPDEGMVLSMTAKQPGLTMNLRSIHLDAPYALSGASIPDAYETLLHDALLGEAGLFTRADGVEECWRIIAPIMQTWSEEKTINTYPAGSYEIPGLAALMDDCEGSWRDLSATQYAYSRLS